MPDPREVVDGFMAGLEGDTRRLAAGEWGVTVEAGGWPLHVGVALRDGLLRAQAQVAAPEALDPHALLHWNRQVPLVRFSHTSSGEIWIQAELPPPAITARELDRVLGLLVRVAGEAREVGGGALGRFREVDERHRRGEGGWVESGARSFCGAKSTLHVVLAPQNPGNRLRPLPLSLVDAVRLRRSYAARARARSRYSL